MLVVGVWWVLLCGCLAKTESLNGEYKASNGFVGCCLVLAVLFVVCLLDLALLFAVC